MISKYANQDRNSDEFFANMQSALDDDTISDSAPTASLEDPTDINTAEPVTESLDKDPSLHETLPDGFPSPVDLSDATEFDPDKVVDGGDDLHSVIAELVKCADVLEKKGHPAVQKIDSILSFIKNTFTK